MLILASQSPRRREILTTAGIPHEVRITGVPEEAGEAESAEDYVRRLARAKAFAVDGNPVLGADTVVVLDGQILEKPRDERDARRMLRLLSGRVHRVLTGYCVRSLEQTESEVCETQVRFVNLSDQEIDDYVRSGEPMDKAGAYAVQGLASKFIDRIEGDYFNVVGLPIAPIYASLRRLGCL